MFILWALWGECKNYTDWFSIEWFVKNYQKKAIIYVVNFMIMDTHFNHLFPQ